MLSHKYMIPIYVASACQHIVFTLISITHLCVFLNSAFPELSCISGLTT